MAKNINKILGWTLLGLVLAVFIGGTWLSRELRKYEENDPRAWKKDIRELTKDDRKTTYPENAVLFVGSSSIRLWETLEEDMHPIPVIQRGFGGAKIGDVLYWAPKIILKYKTNKIVVFAGTNDIVGSEYDATPQEVADKTKELANLIHQNKPDTKIYYISITPTPDRWKVWPRADSANRIIQQFAEETQNFVFLDFAAQFLLEDGTPDSSLFIEDGLHLNGKGYGIWTEGIR